MSYTTLELKVDYVRGSRTTPGRSTRRARWCTGAGESPPPKVGSTIAATGKLVAHASTTCLIVEPRTG